MSRGASRRKGNDGDAELSQGLGKTIQRLRKAYNMSLGELSEQSGVAKSIISQIERNETNPTIGTVMRLSKALDTTIDEVLKPVGSDSFIAHQTRSGVPKLESEDGLCRLNIAGPLDLVEHIQWYDFQAEPGGVLDSEAHQTGTTEHLYVIAGELEVKSGGDVHRCKAGECLRYRGDQPHSIRNVGEGLAHATMVLILRNPL